MAAPKHTLAFIRRITKFKMYFRWHPFEVLTDEGRRDERYRRALLTTAANILSKALAMLVLLLSVPLTIHYLGQERFGVWMTIASFSAMLTFMDLGIGNSLLNLVAQTQARSENERQVKIISNGLVILMIIGGLSCLVLLTIQHFIPWESVIKIKEIALRYEIKQSIITFILIFSLSIPLLGVQRIFLGLQEGYITYLVAAGGNATSLLALYFATRYHSGIPVLLIATFGVQTICLLAPLFLLVKRRLMALSHLSIHSMKNVAPELLKPGLVFFILQIGAMVGWGADILLISSLLGASYVAIFAVAQRLFQFVTQPLALLVSPFWATYADAIVRGDKLYARTTLKASMLFSAFASILVSGTFLLFHEEIINFWIGGDLVLPYGLVVGYAIWSIIDSIGITFAMFLNGAGILRPQLLVVLMFTSITLPAKAYLLPKIGLSGIMFITIAGYILAVAIPYLTFLKAMWKRPLGL